MRLPYFIPSLCIINTQNLRVARPPCEVRPFNEAIYPWPFCFSANCSQRCVSYFGSGYHCFFIFFSICFGWSTVTAETCSSTAERSISASDSLEFYNIIRRKKLVKTVMPPPTAGAMLPEELDQLTMQSHNTDFVVTPKERKSVVDPLN